MPRILIAEDDKEIAMLERDYMESDGMEVKIIADGREVAEELQRTEYDLLLLDLMLPGKNGYEICREIWDRIDIPILMVTARSETTDRIRGLGLGADDYIAKPFDPAELVARVRSHLRQYKRLTGAVRTDGKRDDVIQIGKLKIEPKSFQVYRGEEEIRLPNREFELLKFLAMNPNIVFSREELFEKIWGYDYVGDSATVTVHVNRIREKIEEDSRNPQIIETVWGAGYRLNLR